MYKVVTADEFGLNVIQQDGFNTFDEADKEAKDCVNFFGSNGHQFWVEPYEKEPYKKEKQYNNNAVDGWEDMFPNYNY